MTIDITPAGQPEAAPAANTEQSWPEGWDRVGALETSVVGLLTVQLVIGYEWFISGLTKLWRGGFATGLSGELRDKSVGVTGGPQWFLDRVVIPHGWAFGWFVLAAELALGLTLIGVTAVFLARRHELRVNPPDTSRPHGSGIDRWDLAEHFVPPRQRCHAALVPPEERFRRRRRPRQCDVPHPARIPHCGRQTLCARPQSTPLFGSLTGPASPAAPTEAHTMHAI